MSAKPLQLGIPYLSLQNMVKAAVNTGDTAVIYFVVRMVAVKLAGGIVHPNEISNVWATRAAPMELSDWFAQLRLYFIYRVQQPNRDDLVRVWKIDPRAAAQAETNETQIIEAINASRRQPLTAVPCNMADLDRPELRAKLDELIVEHEIAGLRFVSGHGIGEAGYRRQFSVAPTSVAFAATQQMQYCISELSERKPEVKVEPQGIWIHPVTLRKLAEVHADLCAGDLMTSPRWIGPFTLSVRTSAIFRGGLGRTNGVLSDTEELVGREAILPILAKFFAVERVENITGSLGNPAKSVAESNAGLVAAANDWNARAGEAVFRDHLAPAARETLFLRQAADHPKDFGPRMTYAAFRLPELDEAKTAAIAARVPDTLDFEGHPVPLSFHPEIAAVFDLFDLRWWRAGESLRLPDDRRARVTVRIGGSKEEMPGDVVRGLILDRPDWLLLEWSVNKSAKRDTLKPNSPDARFPDELEEAVIGYRDDGTEIKAWGGPTEFNRGWGGDRVADFRFTWFAGRVAAQSALDQMRELFEVERAAWNRHFADITELKAAQGAAYFPYLPGNVRNEIDHAVRAGASRQQVTKARELLALNRDAALMQLELEGRGVIRRNFTMAVGNAKDGTIVSVWVLRNDGSKREGRKGETRASGLRDRTWEMIGPDELALQYRKPADGPTDGPEEFTVVKLPIGGLSAAQTAAVGTIEDILGVARGSWRLPLQIDPGLRRRIYHAAEEACPDWFTNGKAIPYAANLDQVVSDGLTLDIPSEVNELLEDGASTRTVDGKLAYVVQIHELVDIGTLEVLAVSMNGGWREAVRITLKR